MRKPLLELELKASQVKFNYENEEIVGGWFITEIEEEYKYFKIIPAWKPEKYYSLIINKEKQIDIRVTSVKVNFKKMTTKFVFIRN